LYGAVVRVQASQRIISPLNVVGGATKELHGVHCDGYGGGGVRSTLGWTAAAARGTGGVMACNS